MGKVILYHGSSEIIERPIYGKGKEYNDYGQGFYCTKHIELAKEWATTEGISGYVNQYEIETDRLHMLNLFSDEYTILHWMALLVEHRKFRLTTPLMRKGAQWLKENYLINVREYDVVIGYRADDSYFSFARAFLNNEISLRMLSHAMKLGELGEQFVLISPKSFDEIRFCSYEIAEHTIYYAKRKARDEAARKAYAGEIEKEDMEGIYIRDMIREEMMPDDERLRQTVSG